MKKILLTCAAAGLLVGSTVASAAAIAPAPMFHPWYVGVGLKWNATLEQKHTLNIPGLGRIPATVVEHKLNNSLGWDLFAGYMVSPKFGTELGFVDYGKAKRELTVSTASPSQRFKVQSNGWLVYFDGMYYVPVAPHFKVFAKGGVDYIDHTDKLYTTNTAAYDTQQFTRKYSPVSGNVGAGLQFDYNQFAARLTYTNYSMFLNSTDLGDWYVPDLLNLDFMYMFG